MKKLESSMQLTTALKQVTDGQLVPAPTLRCPAGYGAPAPPGEHATAPQPEPSLPPWQTLPPWHGGGFPGAKQQQIRDWQDSLQARKSDPSTLKNKNKQKNRPPPRNRYAVCRGAVYSRDPTQATLLSSVVACCLSVSWA